MADQARNTQFGTEILSGTVGAARNSQLGAEILAQVPTEARNSQFGAEVLSSPSYQVRNSQLIVELMVRFLPPPVLPGSTLSWRIHRCDTKPSTGQTS